MSIFDRKCFEHDHKFISKLKKDMHLLRIVRNTMLLLFLDNDLLLISATNIRIGVVNVVETITR